MTRQLTASVLALALAGCGGNDARKDDTATAGGEVLPGSASDAMLPLDTVRSQAPAAPNAEGSGKAKTVEKADEKSTSAAEVPAAQAVEPSDSEG